MKKKIVKLAVGMSLLVTLSVVGVQSTSAYVLEGWRYTYKDMTYKWGDRLQSSSVIKTGWTNATTAWKNSNGMNLYQHNLSINLLNSWYESSSTYYGRMTTTYNSNKFVTKLYGELNSGNSNMTKSNVAKSTAVHEFGHSMGIGHNSGSSIMNSNRDRTKVYNPTQDDINGIKSIYK